MLDTSCCSAAVLPKAASIRCTSSTQKWNTYTACARIRPRYSGSCSHRLAKIIDGRGRSGATGMDLGRDMAHTKGVFGGRRDSSVASPIIWRSALGIEAHLGVASLANTARYGLRDAPCATLLWLRASSDCGSLVPAPRHCL